METLYNSPIFRFDLQYSILTVYVVNTAAVRHLMWWQCNKKSVSALRG